MIRPTAFNIFAEPIPKEIQRQSGLFIAQESAEMITMARAVSVGSKVTEVKPGETIIYKPYAVTEIKVDDKDYLLVNEEDVMGVKE